MKTQKFGMKNTYTIYKFVDGKKQVLAHFHNLVTARMKQQLTALDLQLELRKYHLHGEAGAVAGRHLEHPVYGKNRCVRRLCWHGL